MDINDIISNEFVVTPEQQEYLDGIDPVHRACIALYFADKELPKDIGKRFRLKPAAVCYIVKRYQERFGLKLNRGNRAI